MTAPRLLVVVAHPDDETFGCGSILLHADARGATTSVCCATRGEGGEPAPGSGVSRDRLGDVREGELRRAASFMGVDHIALLGYRDSGMTGAPGPDALVSAPVDNVAAAVATVIDDVRPHVVVTLDGSDGHRDHAHVRDATLAAVGRAAWAVQRVHLQCIPRSLLRRWADHMRFERPDSPYLDVDGAGLGTPDDEIDIVIDVSDHIGARRAAIACHVSQTSPFASLPEEITRAFLGTDYLRQLNPAPHARGAGPAAVTDLFSGVDLSD